MRIVRLANLLEVKYNLKSEAASLQDVMKGIKSEILTVYKNYISARSSAKAYNGIPFFAQQGEPHTVEIMQDMEKIVANIDKLATNPSKLFKMVNEVLGTIKELDAVIKEGRESPERLDRESQLNQYRHEVKKLEESLKRVSSMLFKQAKILQKFVPGQELAGEPTIPRRKPLSKEKLRMFMMTPAAHKFGLNNMEVMTKLLEDFQLREMLTTVINAIDRGHLPMDGPELYSEVAKIVSAMEQKKTNEPYFEAGEEEAQQMGHVPFVSPQLKKEKEKQKQEEEVAQQQMSEQEAAHLKSQIEQRDKEHRERMIEEDRNRHIRSESVSKLLDKLLLKGIYENS